MLTPLTQEEANALRKAGFAQAKEYQAQLKELTATNKELEERLKMLMDENASLMRERDAFSNRAKRAQEELAPYLAGVMKEPQSVVDIFESLPQPVGYPSARTSEEIMKGSVGDSKVSERDNIKQVFDALSKLENGTLGDVATVAGITTGEAHNALLILLGRGLATKTGDTWGLSLRERMAARLKRAALM